MRSPAITTRLFALLIVLFSVCALPYAALADDTSQGLVVTPVVIDEQGKARDIINESIALTNNSDQPVELYPSVNDVNDETGEQAFSYAQDASGLTDSLSNWIELSRGVIDLSPGQNVEVPFTITISPNADPGTYHAIISFGEGNTRDEAQ